MAVLSTTRVAAQITRSQMAKFFEVILTLFPIPICLDKQQKHLFWADQFRIALFSMTCKVAYSVVMEFVTSRLTQINLKRIKSLWIDEWWGLYNPQVRALVEKGGDRTENSPTKRQKLC